MCNARAGGMTDCVENSRRGRNERRLADTFCSVRSERLRIFDDVHDDGRNIACRGDQIIVQIVGLPTDVLLHQRHPQPLSNAAVYLSLHLCRIDSATHIMRGMHAQHLYGAQLQIHLHFGKLCGKTIGCIRHTLTVCIERRGRRIEISFTRGNIPISVHWNGTQIDAPAFRLEYVAVEHHGRVAWRAQHRQEFAAQCLAGKSGCVPRHECLSRGRRLPGVGGQIGVAHDLIEQMHGHAERIGADLRQDRAGALSDVHCAVVEKYATALAQPHTNGRWIRDHGVADPVPHAGDTHAAPRSPARARELLLAGIESRRCFQRLHPRRPEAQQTLVQTSARSQHLAGGSRLSRADCIHQSKLEAVHVDLFGEIIEQRLVHDGRLRHAEPTEGTRDRPVGVHRSRQRTHVRNEIRARRVNRHAVRDGVPPRSISAGVEITEKVRRDQLAVVIASKTRVHLRRVALGGGNH